MHEHHAVSERLLILEGLCSGVNAIRQNAAQFTLSPAAVLRAGLSQPSTPKAPIPQPDSFGRYTPHPPAAGCPGMPLSLFCP